MMDVDIHFELNGTSFIWNHEKAYANPVKHDGIIFERAATVFFDPFFILVDASREDESRSAVIGYDTANRLLFVVHIERNGDSIRLISARKATQKEREQYDS